MSKRLIVVLGMHRSGTSLVTRAMRVLRAEAGSNLLPAADDNPTGFWEDADVNKLNDDMLALVDGRWYDVSALDDAQASRLRRRGSRRVRRRCYRAKCVRTTSL